MRRILKALTILTVLLMSVILGGCSEETSDSSNVETVSETTEDTEYTSFSSLTGNFTAEIPKSWIQSNNGNRFTVTERNTGAYITIIREDYYPMINTYSQSTLSAMYAAEGSTLQAFEKPSGNELKVKLTYTKNNIPISEYRYIYWTYSSVYYISYICETEDAESFFETYEKVYESFSLLTDEKTISFGYACSYNDAMKISIEYPLNWIFSAINNGFSVKNEQTESIIYIEVVDPITNFSELSQLDYFNILKNISNEVSLSLYSNSGSSIVGEGFYTYGARRILIQNILYDRTDFTLSLTYISAADYSAVDREVFENMVESVNYY